MRERLVRDGRLALDELRRSASWLGARLRRAGVEHGMAFALDLQAGDEGLLLVASDLMARLRDPEFGCPWDLQQSYATIVPHTLEEAY
ncbi:hypothetical protein WA852_28700, partial [Pseudomonas aeruginosa]